jgi:hypothetical protein
MKGLHMIPVQRFNWPLGPLPDYEFLEEVVEAQPIPELPPEVWHRTEASGDERMRAVMALCGG